MTAITHPVISTHHILTIVVTAVVSVALTVVLMLVFRTTNSPVPTSHLTRADTTLCQEFANATPGSPAAFRLAEAIAAQGSC